MPITKSATKAAARSLKLQARNVVIKDRMKDAVKNMMKLKDKGENIPQKMLSDTYKYIDKALKVGLLKPNTAARRKAKVAKLLAK